MKSHNGKTVIELLSKLKLFLKWYNNGTIGTNGTCDQGINNRLATLD